MEKKDKIELIKAIEEKYQLKKSYVSISDVTKEQSVIDFIMSEPNIFFPASKSRIIMTHWLLREIRKTYEKVAFTPIDITNEVYENLRKKFNTKAFNRAKLKELFGLTTDTIMPYEYFENIESKCIEQYNAIVPNEMKLPTINHIFVNKNTVCSDLKVELNEILSKERSEGVIYARSIGRTLDNIGKEYGITRERARQIELKPKALVERWMDDRHEELIKVFGGKILADPKKAEAYFGEKRWSMLKYCTTSKEKQKFSHWHLIKELDTICYSDTFYNDILKILEECSETYETEDNTLKKIQEKYDFITKNMMKKFYETGGCYIYDEKLHNNKLNLGRSIIAAVEEKFKDGVKISDPVQLKEFANYINEKYGLHVKPNRALTARMQDILVMCDRATYKSPKFVTSSETLDEKITKYISDLKEDRVTYQLFYDALPKDLLEKSGINTYSGLHGYIKKHEKELGVIALRYYVCKGETKNLKSKDFFQKFNDWLKEQKKPCTTEEIIKSFDGWTDMYPKYAMLYFPQIVQWGNGRYMNLDAIQVSDEATEKASKIIEDCTNNRLKYTNAYVIYPKLKQEVPELFEDPQIQNENHIFLLLKYKMLNKNEYVFAKPHIIRSSVMSGKTDYTTEDLIRQVIGKRTLISKPDITDEIMKFYGCKNSSLCLATQHVLDGFCRVGTTTYYKKSAIKLTKKNEEQIDDFITKNLHNGKFLVPSKIEDFSGLPKTSFDWNSWALCSIVELFSKKYRIMFKRNNIVQNSMVIVPISSSYKSREQIAASLLNEEYNGLHDEESIIKYLKDLGLFVSILDTKNIEKEGINFEITSKESRS